MKVYVTYCNGLFDNFEIDVIFSSREKAREYVIPKYLNSEVLKGKIKEELNELADDLIDEYEIEIPEVNLGNEWHLGDTFIDWKIMSSQRQWQRIDNLLHENGLKVIRIDKE